MDEQKETDIVDMLHQIIHIGYNVFEYEQYQAVKDLGLLTDEQEHEEIRRDAIIESIKETYPIIHRYCTGKRNELQNQSALLTLTLMRSHAEHGNDFCGLVLGNEL